MAGGEENKVYVGNLSYGTTDETLRAHFESIGDISDASIVREREDDSRSRGFGFVTFYAAQHVEKAVKELNDSELDGRTIRVARANARGGGGGGGGGRRGGFRGSRGGGGRWNGGGGGGRYSDDGGYNRRNYGGGGSSGNYSSRGGGYSGRSYSGGGDYVDGRASGYSGNGRDW